MWTTGELASSLLGFCAMGTGIWLFCPEIYDLFKYPPREMDRARLIFFASWLVGDFLHLFGTVFSGHAQTTQIALYIIVASIESFVLVYILFHLGHIPFFKPKRYPVEDVLEKQRDWRYPLQHSIVHAMGVGPDLKMPPRDKRLEEHRRARDQPAIDAANASRRARGLKDHAPKKEIPDTQMALIQIAGTLFVLLIFTAIWYAVTYINRDTKEPPEPMKMSLVAFLPGWAGFFFWVGPRFVSMWQSYSLKKKEGITNGAIFVGGLTHSLNIASIVLINFQGEGLLAQSPYIATSACCVVLDIFRLFLKRHYPVTLPPDQDHSTLYPARAFYDPEWMYNHEKAQAKTKRKADAVRTKGHVSGADGRGAQRGLLGRSGRRSSSDEEERVGSGGSASASSDDGGVHNSRRGRLGRAFKRSPAPAHSPDDASTATTDEDDPLADARHAKYLKNISYASGGLGYGRQLLPARYPNETDKDYEERMIRAKATKDFLARRVPQEQRLAALKGLHGRLDERRDKTLRREQKYADPTTSTRRRTELEGQLHTTETVLEPQLHEHVAAIIDDPTLTDRERQELEHHHARWAHSDNVASKEAEVQRYRAVRHSKVDGDEGDERLRGAGEAYEGWRPGMTLGRGERPESLRVEHESEDEEQREEEQRRRRRLAEARRGKRPAAAGRST